MAKETGLGDNLYVDGYDLSGDVGSIQRIGGGPAALELTGINASAFERAGGVRDGSIDYSAWFNTAAGQAHPVLSALPTTDRIVTYFRGTALGNPAASIVCKQLTYDGTRAEDGSLSFSVPNPSDGFGLEWGDQLTAGKRTDTEATAGTGWEDPGQATTNFGLQAYLHVFAFTGTDATITIQESSDNGADTYANVTGGAFTQVTTAPVTERIATATDLAVEQFLKVTTTTSAGFTSLTFAVMIVRNGAVPAF